MIPLTVTAQMAGGVAHSLPWGISLDGILASAVWRRAKPTSNLTEPALDAEDPPDLDLPLARCAPPNETWHWAATCSWPDPVPAHPDVHYWMGRNDHRALEQLTTALPKVISDRQGRWRAHRMPLITYPCRTLTWTAIGDPDAICDLLSDVRAIGKKRSQGEGVVLNWTITVSPDLDQFSAAHLSPTGVLARPTPSGCLAGHSDLVTGGCGLAGIRPPSMHPSRIKELHLPAPVMA